MLWIMRFSGFFSTAMVMIVLSPSLQSFPSAKAIRSSYADSVLRFSTLTHSGDKFSFRRTPAPQCRRLPLAEAGKLQRLQSIAITLDVEYLRGSVAAVLSVLQHFKCPKNMFFHFLVPEIGLEMLVRSTFPEFAISFQGNEILKFRDSRIFKGMSPNSILIEIVMFFRNDVVFSG